MTEASVAGVQGDRTYRILVVNPNTTAAMTHSIAEMARRAAPPDVEITAVQPALGVASIEGHADELVASYHTLTTVLEHVPGHDAVVVACFSDPAVPALRELCDVPVVGIAESAFRLASLVGHRFGIVSVMPRMAPILRDLVRRTGFVDQVASLRCADLTVLQIEEDEDAAAKAMIADARESVVREGAEAIVLGCAGLGPLDRRVQDAVGVPVFDGVVSGVLLASSLVRYGMTTSRAAAYRQPEKKAVTGLDEIVAQHYRP